MPLPSAPADTAEPLVLTVHGVEAPNLGDGAAAEARRTAVGRAKMLALVAACAAPVALAYLMFFVFRAGPNTSYAALIQPPRELPAATWSSLDGQPVPAASLRGQWLLVALVPERCEADCERLLLLQRQLREMLGHDRERVDKVVLQVGESPLSQALRTALAAAPAATVLRADRASVAAWLQPAPGQALEAHLYLVDPLGHWMMRAPAPLDPYKFKRDLERLLRASASWDRAGR